MTAAYYNRPFASQGYWRGGGSDGVPLAGGQGSGMGPTNQGVGFFSQGQGISLGSAQWEPTILYLVAFVVAEMIVFGFISRALR